MSDMMAINMNVQCEVTLTKRGKQILQNFKDEHNMSHLNILIINSEGKLKTELWQLFQIFGPSVWQGCDIPFELNEINMEF